MFCVLVFGSLSYVPSARSLLREEREKTRRERTAFEAFADRVGRLSASAPTAVASGPQQLVRASGGADAQLSAVRDAYRDTVMAVDHYEREYGADAIDTYCISMTEAPSHVLEVLFLADQVDVVSVHLAATKETIGFIDRAFLAAMREGAILVNTSRGGADPVAELISQ